MEKEKKNQQITVTNREGLPCSEEALKEHLKAFSDIEDCIAFVDKKGKEL